MLDIICQIVYAKLEGDYIVTVAFSHELPQYGVKVGLTNYAAAYCTRLLVARGMLTKLDLADKYEEQVEISGEDFNVEAMDDGPKPFRAFLDMRLTRITTGNQVFAAMKGAVDIPHGMKRLIGYDTEADYLDADVCAITFSEAMCLTTCATCRRKTRGSTSHTFYVTSRKALPLTTWNKCIKMHTQKYVRTCHTMQSPREKISSPWETRC